MPRVTVSTVNQGHPDARQHAWRDAAVRAKVVDFRCPIEIGGVQIVPGDIIVGDLDGVLVIPARFGDEVIESALEKSKGEKVVRTAIEAGMTSTEAFRKYGIL